MFRKNVAGQHFSFQGVDSSTGGIKSGVTWTVRRCIDGTFAAATGTVTEDGTTGWYKFAMSQADTNGNNIGFNFVGTGAVPQTVNIVTTVLNPTAADFGIVIAKGTNITGLNDIAATAVVSAGAITTSSGAVSSVTTVGTVNALAAGAIQAIWDALTSALTTASSIGKLLVDNIDAAISTRATPAQVNTECDTALADYDGPTNAELVSEINSVQSDIAALNNLSAAQVNAEVVDALNVDTYAEPGQGNPPATATLVQKMGYLYKAFRNKIVSTDSQISLYNDAGDTVDQKASHTDDGSTYTRNEFTTGP